MFAKYKFILMKSISLRIIFLFISILGLISCKKDDDTVALIDIKAENRKSLGTSSEDLLSNDGYSKLTVEFVFSESYRPTSTTVNDFRIFLEERLNKPSGINFVETIINESAGAPFNTNEIKAIEEENRTIYSQGNNIAVYIFFSNGKSSNDTNTTVTLGTAYLNTSIVIYEKTLRDLVIDHPSLSLSDLESTTMQHEFGHILGLVNIIDDDIHTDHEDNAHNLHCKVEDCLMYFESNLRSQIITRFSNRRSVVTLDPLCVADLRSKGGK